MTATLRLTTSWDDGHPLDLRLADRLAARGFTGTFYVPRHNREGRPVLSAREVRAARRAVRDRRTLARSRASDPCGAGRAGSPDPRRQAPPGGRSRPRDRRVLLPGRCARPRDPSRRAGRRVRLRPDGDQPVDRGTARPVPGRHHAPAVPPLAADLRQQLRAARRLARPRSPAGRLPAPPLARRAPGVAAATRRRAGRRVPSVGALVGSRPTACGAPSTASCASPRDWSPRGTGCPTPTWPARGSRSAAGYDMRRLSALSRSWVCCCIAIIPPTSCRPRASSSSRSFR